MGQQPQRGRTEHSAPACRSREGSCLWQSERANRGRDVERNKRTALAFVRLGYAKLDGDDSIEITREGEIKVGNVKLSRAERRRRKEAETLQAQATGQWKPAPAGASASASRKDWESRTDFACAGAEVGLAQSALSDALEMLDLAREWGGSNDLKHEREEVERCRARVGEAQREFDRIRGTKVA